MDNLISQIKVETLYYFYSAIFQGFAAMFTLILMFVIYYFQKNDGRRYYFEQELENTAMSMFSKNHIDYELNRGKGIYEFIKGIISKRNLEQDKRLHELISNCDELINKEEFIKKELGFILLLSFVILLASIFLLFTIDIIFKNSYLSFYLACALIVLMIIYFILSGHLMYVIIGYKFLNKPIKWFLEH